MSENAAPILDAGAQTLGPKERILQASLKLFVEQGYFNTNIPDISKASNASVGSIYHHFLNKEEIAQLLYAYGIKIFREHLANALESSEGLEDTIKTTVHSFLEFSQKHTLESRYIWLCRHDEFIKTETATPTLVGFDKLGRRLTKAIKSGIRSKELKDVKADVIWTVLFGIPLSFIRDWLDGYTSQTPIEAADQIADACWSALKSD